jgi:hypothetical protein
VASAGRVALRAVGRGSVRAVGERDGLGLRVVTPRGAPRLGRSLALPRLALPRLVLSVATLQPPMLIRMP